MGWWRIDPKTGAPIGQSSLSRPPEFVLLNAVPGADDAADACYLGDGAGDMVSESVRIVRGIIGPRPIPADEVRMLFAEEIVPPSLAELNLPDCERVLTEIAALWSDLDGCYEDDWNRGPNPAEKTWLVEYAVERLAAKNEP